MQLKPLWNGFAYKPHQVKGVEWMLGREKDSPAGGILCDEMGLGKTIQMLGLVKESGRGDTLLLAPVAVLSQWEETAKRCNIAVFRAATGARFVEWKPVGAVLPGAPRLHIIGYESGKARKELLRARIWSRLICDEAHRCAPKNGIHAMVKEIAATSRWFLTATPIVNGLQDLTHLLELLGVEKASSVSQDVAGLKKYIMARSMDDLRASIPDAPPKPVETKVSLPFSTEEESEFYKGMSGVIVKRWKALGADGGGALLRLQLFLRLRQLSLHPQIYIAARRKALGVLYERPDWVGSSTKFEAIQGLVEKGLADAKPHKWIIFCHFHPEMELLAAAMRNIRAVRRVWTYNGTLSMAERKVVLDASLEPLEAGQADVLLIQLQSGGVGLNLVGANRMFLLDIHW
jgi:SNF2 family DNA or RNA helicase